MSTVRRIIDMAALIVGILAFFVFMLHVMAGLWHWSTVVCGVSAAGCFYLARHTLMEMVTSL